MTSLRIGLIGTDYMGKCHALAWNAVGPVFGDVDRPRLAMLGEASDALAERRARELGFERSTGDWRRLVADPDPARRPGQVTRVFANTGQTLPWATRALASAIALAFALELAWGGSEYVPTSNAWTSITALGPPARAGHTAVWTGSDMIVWGGTDPAGAPVSTGGRFSPTSLSWRTMSATGAPSARSGHAAGWNGKDMVVWGGKDAAGSPLASGARYTTPKPTPAALSAAGAPAARFEHSVVFTYAEMIFFGGTGAGDDPRDDGGRYCACVQVTTFYRDADLDTYGDPKDRYRHRSGPRS